jgi:hypothetical protein
MTIRDVVVVKDLPQVISKSESINGKSNGEFMRPLGDVQDCRPND